MSIVMIYHHQERERAEPLRASLEQKGYAVKLAPLGFEVGSAEWQAQAKADIEAAKAVLGLLSVKASDDPWVNWRIEAALHAGKMFIPLMLEICNPPIALRYYQMAFQPAMAEQDILESLARVGITPQRSCFMSYARADADFATKLAASLRDKGVKIWRDVDDIPAGASWDAEIQNALNQCSHLLLVATPESVQSPNVADEISFALNKGKTVIPVILKPCELPLRVHRAQWVDFQGNYDTALSELLRNLGMM
jgi:hypothetical protein